MIRIILRQMIRLWRKNKFGTICNVAVMAWFLAKENHEQCQTSQSGYERGEKVKFVPAYALKVYGGTRNIGPPFHQHGARLS